MFEGQKIIIATQHKKEEILSPLLEQYLGLVPVICASLNTDILGTFTGEVERTEDPLTTARQKCTLGMNKTGIDIGISNEGSFGQHPNLFFVPAGDEIMLFKDRKNNIEIAARSLSTDTNYNTQEIHHEDELRTFAEKVLFPSHGLIIRDSKKNSKYLVKGIRSWEVLNNSFHEIIKENKYAIVETDMRAMHNPTRMTEIGKACEKLIKKIKSLCPHCECPGFSITSAIPGLACAQCGQQTKSILYYIYSCQRCQFEQKEIYPQGIEEEDPMYCDHCNP